MADNFNMKQFLTENKLGPYSKIKETSGTTNEIKVLRDLYYFDKLNTLATKDDVDEKYHSYGTLWAEKGDTLSPDSEEYDMVLKSKKLKKGKDYTNESFPKNETKKDKTEEAASEKDIAIALGSNNPEGDALILRFLKGIAKKYDYPVAQAARFVKERIKKLGY